MGHLEHGGKGASSTLTGGGRCSSCSGKYPEAQLYGIAAGETAVCTKNGGEEFEMGIKEHSLVRLGYVVAYQFH